MLNNTPKYYVPPLNVEKKMGTMLNNYSDLVKEKRRCKPPFLVPLQLSLWLLPLCSE